MLARVLGGLVVASVGVNAYLLATRPHAERAETKEADEAPEPERAPTPKPVPPEVSALDRSRLEKELAEVEAKLEPLLPLSEKFGREPRSPEYEEKARPFLDKLFKVHPGEEPAYDFECHGRICHLITDAPHSEWQHDLQLDPDRFGILEDIHFTGGDTYVVVADAGHTAGWKLFRAIAEAFGASPRVDQCKRDNPEPGKLVLVLVLDPTTRKVEVKAFGSLADRPGGICIRHVLEDAASAIPVPAEATALPGFPFQFKVP